MIDIQRDGEIAILRMNHGKVNALDLEMLEAIVAAVGEVQRSDATALVITGTGKIFSAGADLLRVLGEGRTYIDKSLPVLSEAFLSLFRFPKPAIAAINGHAIAGGAILAFACDHRVMAAERGTIGVAELRVGVPYPVAALEIVRFAVGAKGLQELVYFGDNYPPDVALARSMVDELAPADQVVAVAVERARRLASIPAESFAHVKAQLRRPVLERIERDGRLQDPVAADLWASEPVRASIQSFLENLASSR